MCVSVFLLDFQKLSYLLNRCGVTEMISDHTNIFVSDDKMIYAKQLSGFHTLRLHFVFYFDPMMELYFQTQLGKYASLNECWVTQKRKKINLLEKLSWSLLTDVGPSFDTVYYSRKIILQQLDILIIMWIIINWSFCRGWYTFFGRENQVWHFKVEITNFRNLFKPKIDNKFYTSCIAGRFSCNRVIKLRSHICTWPTSDKLAGYWSKWCNHE